MRRTGLLIALIVSLGWTSGAHAHWQNTKWGMTEAEVRTVWPAATERHENGYYVLRIDGPVTIAGVTYQRVSFTFDTKGRLRQVSLSTDMLYNLLVDRLISQIGAPVLEKDEPLFGGLRSLKATFRDEEKSNTISVSSFVGGTAAPPVAFITYSETEKGF
jgi:hypothetical protein